MPTTSTERGKTMNPPAREPSHDDIARRAYALWEKDGRPFGRDLDYWLRAEADLRRAAYPTARPKAAPGGRAEARRSSA
jgi:hypothetical protein